MSQIYTLQMKYSLQMHIGVIRSDENEQVYLRCAAVQIWKLDYFDSHDLSMNGQIGLTPN